MKRQAANKSKSNDLKEEEEKEEEEEEEEAILYRCETEEFKSLPKPLIKCIGWVTIMIFSFSFVAIPIGIIVAIAFPPHIYIHSHPIIVSTVILLFLGSFMLPEREIVSSRLIGQTWYEIFDFSTNVSPKRIKELLEQAPHNQYIIGMHPHGIVPFQAVLWATYCHQYLKNDKFAMYGFGAAANVVKYIPFIRNFMIWLSAGSADYKVLRDGLLHGKCDCVNAAGRKPRNLYILPGGIAEIFTSTPGKHTVVFKDRKGLIRLSIETGAQLIPTYVFGGTCFFHNLATSSGIFAKLGRKLRLGITFFWGQYGLPIPFTPKVSMIIGEPIPSPRFDGPASEIPQEMINDLHTKYLNELQRIFNKYKDAAGYTDGVLEII